MSRGIAGAVVGVLTCAAALGGSVAVAGAARTMSPAHTRELAGTSVVRRARPRFSVGPRSLPYRGGRVVLGWSSSHATRCTLSARPRFWSGPNPRRVRCRGKLTATLPAVALGMRWKFTFRARNPKGKAAVVRRTFAIHAPPFATSSNWAGYVVPSTAPVTLASGEFTVPTLDCRKTRNAGEAAWVGIGGAGELSGDLLQTGVLSDCTGGAQTVNPGWWEEFPEVPIVAFHSMSVSPGDRIEASVYQDADGSWSTRLDDLTRGVSGVMHTGDAWGTVLDSDPATWTVKEGDASAISYSGGDTAEWIVEDFAGAGGAPVPFADFGNLAFSNLTTSLPSWALTPPEAVGIGDEFGLLLAAPSAPDATGRGFSVTYTG